jgi:putative transposase
MPNRLIRQSTKPAQCQLKTQNHIFNFRFNRKHGHVGHGCPTYREWIMKYRRVRIEGGCYFFTVALADRKSDLLVANIDALRAAVRAVKASHSFTIDAMVVLPDHIHALWTLPQGDDNYSMRWMLIKRHFSMSLPKTENIKMTRLNKRERGIWQRRFWEHTIRDERDFYNHIEYIHHNPVKHGYVSNSQDWPYSSIHQFA